MGIIKDSVKGILGMETSGQKAMRRSAEEERNRMQRETERIQAQGQLSSQANLDNLANVSSGGGDSIDIFTGGRKRKPQTTSETLGLGGL